MKEMIKTLLDEIEALTIRAVDAERLAETDKANMEQARADERLWFNGYNRMLTELTELKEQKNDTI